MDADGKKLAESSLRHIDRPSISDGTREEIGSAEMDIGSGVPRQIKVKASYVINTGHGMAVPMGTSVNSWHVVPVAARSVAKKKKKGVAKSSLKPKKKTTSGCGVGRGGLDDDCD